MDIGTVRGLITGALIVLFLALVVWAFSSKRKEQFDRAARTALEEDETLEKGKK
ncbi:MAG TPA: cbb3-type cytochrome c oxidase subunit 3 [Steroidobacteraceae bacterium]|nr:cbb3-type cytochrome c oxidase subunit 3 [Steroidobacteraceae bacterium]HRX90783.1 cbb3-type cytochrome c oxidase subunit 3 [Steroidobacteraceae bacterium]